MKSAKLLFLFLMLACPLSFGQKPNRSQPQRILILLNASESMAQSWSGDLNRFQAASGFIMGLMDSLYRIDDQVEFALRVYGHQHPAAAHECFDSRREVMFSKDNRTQIRLRLQSLHPQGLSTVAFALHEASTKDVDDPSLTGYNVILVTDSRESCSRDFCPEAATLVRQTGRKAFVVTLINDRSLAADYTCLGDVLPAYDPGRLAAAIGTIINPYRFNTPDIQLPGFGFLKLRYGPDIRLAGVFRIRNNSVTPVPVSGPEDWSGKKSIQLKTGSYKVVYKKLLSDEEIEKPFSIQPEMITEIEMK